MEHLTRAVRDAVAQENWYAALGLALTLPDICGRSKSPGERSQTRYVAWCNEFLSPLYSLGASGAVAHRVILSGEDCYALRCAVLHEGGDDIVEKSARKALSSFRFLAPDDSGTRVLWNLRAGRLQLHVDLFCGAICDGVDTWLERVRGDDEVEARIGLLMKVHGGGVVLDAQGVRRGADA